MAKPEIKQIADYTNDLEHDLREGDYHENMPALDAEYKELYQAIKRLMDLTIETTDKDMKNFLAMLEMKARDILRQMQDMMVGMN
jgi:hypothetical protein